MEYNVKEISDAIIISLKEKLHKNDSKGLEKIYLNLRRWIEDNIIWLIECCIIIPLFEKCDLWSVRGGYRFKHHYYNFVDWIKNKLSIT